MKILLVIPEYPPDFGGGIVTYYRDLVPALRELGCEVSILKGSAFTHGRPSDHDGSKNVSILETERVNQWSDKFSHFAMFPELRRHLAAAFALHEQASEGEGFDVVEVTDWGMLFLPWVIASKARVLVQLHGSTGQIAFHEPVTGREAEGVFTLLLEKSALALAPGLCSYSRSNVRWWEDVLGRSVDYLPPPLQPFCDEPTPGLGNQKWLSVGRIQFWKGPQVACSAWQCLGQHAPALEWVGRDTVRGRNGSSTDAWLRETWRDEWGKKICPIGQLTPRQVAEKMRDAKAVLVPSTWDVFNFVCAEAMATGKPVIVSEGAGAADLIEHGVNGFVFPKEDASALCSCVRQVQQMPPAKLADMGCAAAQTVRQRLDPARIAAGKLALYRQLPPNTNNPNLRLDEWLNPMAGRDPLGFLDALPLKDLTRYVARRSMRKVGFKKG